MEMLPRFRCRVAAWGAGTGGDRPVFVCFFGDSNTLGWGDGSIQYREAYPTRVIAALHDRHPTCPFVGINAGKGGDTLTAALGRMDRDVIRHAPDLTVLAFGINDVGGGREQLPAFEASLRAALSALLAHTDVVVLTPNMAATRRTHLVDPRYPDALDALIALQTGGVLDAYVQVMRATMGVPVADAYRIWRDMAAAGVDTTLLLANGINHPFGHAHRFFADALLACID